MKKVRLTEEQLRSVIKESVRTILSEASFQYREPKQLEVVMDVEFPEDVTPNPDEAYKDVYLYCSYDYQPEEPQTYDDPGCSAQFDLTDVEVWEEGLTPEEVEYLKNVWIDENWSKIEEAAEEALYEDGENQYGAYESAREDYYDDLRHGI